MDIAIIGSGIIGLLSALTLSDAGYKVTIIARDLPGDETQDWASPWAGAGIFPQPNTTGHNLQIETFKYYWALAHRDPTSGVQVVKASEFYDDRDDDSDIWYKTLVPRYRRIPAKELPLGAKIGFAFQTMAVNPTVFLPWIKMELEGRGVRFIRRELQTIGAARQIAGCAIVVNATGLGAFQLANDKDVVGIRGQTMLVETDFEEMMMLQGSRYSYVIPRMYTGCSIIGGVSQEGSADHSVDVRLPQVMLDGVQGMIPGRLDSVDLDQDRKKDIVAFRPGRRGGFRLGADSDKVVHAYGFGGLGYTFSYGVAMRVRELVEAIRVPGQGEHSSRL